MFNRFRFNRITVLFENGKTIKFTCKDFVTETNLSQTYYKWSASGFSKFSKRPKKIDLERVVAITAKTRWSL